MFQHVIRKELISYLPSVRSGTRDLHESIILNGREEEAIEAIISSSAYAISNAEPLTYTSKKLGIKLYRLTQLSTDEWEKDYTYIRAGIYGLHLAALADLIAVSYTHLTLPTILLV